MNTQEAQEYTTWHEQRMRDLAYPPEIVLELRQARVKFIAQGQRMQERRR